jgi:iron complex transport system substrate-binding protein
LHGNGGPEMNATKRRSLALTAAALAPVLLLTTAVLPSGAPPAQAAAAPKTAASATQTIVDMAGRTVTLPAHITRIADVGATPVINSLLFLFGVGHEIVNNIPTALQEPNFHFEYVFDPSLAKQPTVEGEIGSVNTELLAKAHPQVVFTENVSEVGPLVSAGFKVVVVKWSSFNTLESAVNFVGKILGEPQRAELYDSYLNATIKKVHEDLSSVTPSQEPTVAYLQYTPLEVASGSLGHYWLPLAGAKDVTFGGDATGNYSVSAEDLVTLNPQVLIVQSRSDAYSFEHDPRFAAISAIVHHRVYVQPAGSLAWGNETTETPLVILWAAKLLHPTLTSNIDVVAAAERFYKEFYGVSLSSKQVSQIIDAAYEGTKAP